MTTETAGKFVGALFLSRTVAHILHLKTKSYAQHKALNEFYDSIVDLADAFAEQYQGCYDVRLDIPILSSKDTEDPVKYLRSTVEWIEKTRYKIADKECTSLQNQIDSIVEEFYSVLYLLTLE